ncbi:MAG: 5-formyltetrahydrofolate cyclo-ligase [Nitriliruptoraceae bacterium]
MTPTRRHDHDAGGDQELLAAKAALREASWARLAAAGVTRFPGARHRISNFVGAEAAADRLRHLDIWQHATTIKVNPDSPQWPVRQRALEDGKRVYMAVPRLADIAPFYLLDPDDLADTPRRASSIAGAQRSARQVPLDDLAPVDVVVTGCVAVGRDGRRLGKGGGFSDLEFAVATEAGLISTATQVVTTVHDVQVVAAGEIPVTAHDLHVDVIVTPTAVIRVPRPADWRPARVRWDELTAAKIAAIPLLEARRPPGDG